MCHSFCWFVLDPFTIRLSTPLLPIRSRTRRSLQALGEDEERLGMGDEDPSVLWTKNIGDRDPVKKELGTRICCEIISCTCNSIGGEIFVRYFSEVEGLRLTSGGRRKNGIEYHCMTFLQGLERQASPKS
uniref:Uncharacterized protein n=1 Tax=Cacopsylla melanoneura TaxID=428564 RepID=A0A8D8VNW9_9HEMI